MAAAYSMKTAYTASALYTPLEEVRDPLVFVEDGIISRITSRAEHQVPASTRVTDFADSILVPGFVDIHIHGGAGLDVMLASPEELPRLEIGRAHV